MMRVILGGYLGAAIVALSIAHAQNTAGTDRLSIGRDQLPWLCGYQAGLADALRVVRGKPVETAVNCYAINEQYKSERLAP